MRSFLIHHPFITVEEGKLVGQVFMEEPADGATALQRLRRYLWPGISKVRGHVFSPAENRERAALRSEDGALELGALNFYK
jgi:hypothetical protein